jgi:hypothetical protein
MKGADRDKHPSLLIDERINIIVIARGVDLLSTGKISLSV